MKSYLLLSFALLLSCSSVKQGTSTGGNSQLLQDLEVLSSDAYEGRKTGTKGAEMTRHFITTRFTKLGLKSCAGGMPYVSDFSFSDRQGKKITGKNVIGYIPGKTAAAIVISAHYDHLGVRDNKIFNGADDNASGVAALLKFAAHYAKSKNKPEHTLIFAAFDAEEMGLQGAKAFVANAPVPLDQVLMNINMDMISHNDKSELYACGTFKYPQLKPYLVTTVPGIKVLPGHDDPKMGQDDWTNQSDQGAFNAKNIPFIYFGVEDHKDYHKETDEFQNINKEFYSKAADAIQEIIGRIDRGVTIQSLYREKVQMKKQ
ncbi:M20/M25/M40 family metallo-hydrolase [Pedobacter sp. SYP-B3415]|uniref:M20/M25/M40 family metallo-hydrolase n=1 Tax=Pedobacter sp. SYP-B3415 TaxID=2496641 RepID=UPI00101D7322|nr:M20/M25/M40 family metallo-hydrolase [Pedobacter sp. SYP-B3415]